MDRDIGGDGGDSSAKGAVGDVEVQNRPALSPIVSKLSEKSSMQSFADSSGGVEGGTASESAAHDVMSSEELEAAEAWSLGVAALRQGSGLSDRSPPGALVSTTDYSKNVGGGSGRGDIPTISPSTSTAVALGAVLSSVLTSCTTGDSRSPVSHERRQHHKGGDAGGACGGGGGSDGSGAGAEVPPTGVDRAGTVVLFQARDDNDDDDGGGSCGRREIRDEARAATPVGLLPSGNPANVQRDASPALECKQRCVVSKTRDGKDGRE